MNAAVGSCSACCPSFGSSMAGATDREHALKVGLEQDVIDKFIAAKITTIK